MITANLELFHPATDSSGDNADELGRGLSEVSLTISIDSDSQVSGFGKPIRRRIEHSIDHKIVSARFHHSLPYKARGHKVIALSASGPDVFTSLAHADNIELTGFEGVPKLSVTSKAIASLLDCYREWDLVRINLFPQHEGEEFCICVVE